MLDDTLIKGQDLSVGTKVEAGSGHSGETW